MVEIFLLIGAMILMATSPELVETYQRIKLKGGHSAVRIVAHRGKDEWILASSTVSILVLPRVSHRHSHYDLLLLNETGPRLHLETTDPQLLSKLSDYLRMTQNHSKLGPVETVLYNSENLEDFERALQRIDRFRGRVRMVRRFNRLLGIK